MSLRACTRLLWLGARDFSTTPRRRGGGPPLLSRLLRPSAPAPVGADILSADVPPAPIEVFRPRYAQNANAALQSQSQSPLYHPLRPPPPPSPPSFPPPPPPPPPPRVRSLRCAIVGAPNAGKSTLSNSLCGTHVSAVSPKYNTTRDSVAGFLHVRRGDELVEVVLVDTPGLLPLPGAAAASATAGGGGGGSDGGGIDAGSGRRYVKTLVTAATDALARVDAVLLVVDGARRWDGELASAMATVTAAAAQHGALPLLVINKLDLLRNNERANGARRRGRAVERAPGGWARAAVPTAATEPSARAGSEASPPSLPSAVASTGAAAGTGILSASAWSSLAAATAAPQGDGAARLIAASDAAAAAISAEAAAFPAGASASAASDGGLPPPPGPLASADEILAFLAARFESSCAAAGVARGGDGGGHVMFAISARSGEGVGAVRDALLAAAIPAESTAFASAAPAAAAATAASRLALPRRVDLAEGGGGGSQNGATASAGSALTPRQRVHEIVREKLFLNLHAEVPYSVSQRERAWRHYSAAQSADGVETLIIDLDLVVPRSSVAAMLRARGNGPLKAIAATAAADVEATLGVRTRIFLHVAILKRRRARGDVQAMVGEGGGE